MTSTVKAIYPGSFDPFTCGHLQIALRAKALFPKVEVVICENPTKGCMFPVAERIEFAQAALKGSGVGVTSYKGLLADSLESPKSTVLIRGIRGSEDVLSELSMAHFNAKLAENIETVFMATEPEFRFVSASAARELIRHSEKSSYPKTLQNVLPPEVIKVLSNNV